jgi:hypothetical protein
VPRDAGLPYEAIPVRRPVPVPAGEPVPDFENSSTCGPIGPSSRKRGGEPA